MCTVQVTLVDKNKLHRCIILLYSYFNFTFFVQPGLKDNCRLGARDTVSTEAKFLVPDWII